jgi:hypothetical protein
VEASDFNRKDQIIGMDLGTRINEEERDEEPRYASATVMPNSTPIPNAAASTMPTSMPTSEATVTHQQVNVAVATPSKTPLKKKENVPKKKYKSRRIEMTDIHMACPFFPDGNKCIRKLGYLGGR